MAGIDAEPSGAETPRIEILPEPLTPETALTEPAAGEDLIAAVSEAVERRYGFRIGSLRFLVKQGVQSEVVRSPAIAAIPHSPSWLLGLINLRSNLVPIFNLHDLCGLPILKQAQTAVLILDIGDKAVGIHIDNLPVPLLGLEPISELPPLPEILGGNVDTGYMASGEIWLELDHERLFSFLTCKT